MEKLSSIHFIKKVNGHVEIFDFYNKFICSGDNEDDAMEGYYDLMKSTNRNPISAS